MFRSKPDPRDQVIEYLMKQNADLLDRLQETIGQIHYHQVQAAAKPVEAPAGRLHVDEDEDDAMYQYRTGLINERELQERLAEIGFDNTSLEIEFAN